LKLVWDNHAERSLRNLTADARLIKIASRSQSELIRLGVPHYARMPLNGGRHLSCTCALLGTAIPALVYCLTRIGAAMYIDCHSRG
jgi:hypothetical protein